MNSKNDFASLLEESFKKRKSLEIGALHDVKIITIKNDYIFIQTINGNIKGILSSSEQDDEHKFEIGKIYPAYFLREDSGEYYFTTALADDEITEETLELAYDKEIPVLGQFGIESKNNSGYEVKLGDYNAVCAYSQIDPVLKSGIITGKKFKFIVQEINSKSKKIFLSQKKISDKEKELKKEILKAELKEGSFVNCTIKSIHKFGLIVDMNGMDALVPASESSFKKNVDLEKEFKIGERVHGKILALDWKENKFSVSLKDSSNDPWIKKVPFKEGDILSAKIDSIKPFGLFIKLDEHFHGLVPNKETGLGNKLNPGSQFKVGEIVEVFVTEVNPEKKQIALSIEKAKEAKDKLDFQNYVSNNKEESVSSFGLLLKKSLKK